MAVTFALTNEEVALARSLMIEYRDSISTPLSFQNFDDEMVALPGKYTRPKGCIMIGYVDSVPAGVIALRELDEPSKICEMKRLYVRPSARGGGLGKTLCTQLITFAREAGYLRMRLDTDSYMTPAQALYTSLGFYRIEKYNNDPIPDTLFFEKLL